MGRQKHNIINRTEEQDGVRQRGEKSGGAVGGGYLEGHTLEMGSQPYSSLHFIYIPGRIDQSDWEQSPGLRRGIKRQNAFAALIPL